MNLSKSNHETIPWTDADTLVIQILSPIILLAGVLGNILIIRLRRFRKLTSGRNMLFRALAYSDLCLLLVCLFPKSFESFVHLNLEVKGHWMCKLNTFSFYFIFGVCSWNLATLTVLRALAVVRPHEFHRYSSRCMFVTLLTSIFLISGLVSIYLLFVDSLLYDGCHFGSYVFVMHRKGLLGETQVWIHFMFVFAFPFVIIIVSNYFMISRLKMMSQFLDLSRSSTCSFSIVRATGYNENINVIPISVVFCLSIGPSFLVNALDISEIINVCKDLPSVVLTVFNQVAYVNSAIKFYLYYFTVAKLRREVNNKLGERLSRISREQMSMFGMVPGSSRFSTTASLHFSTRKKSPDNTKASLGGGALHRMVSLLKRSNLDRGKKGGTAGSPVQDESAGRCLTQPNANFADCLLFNGSERTYTKPAKGTVPPTEFQTVQFKPTRDNVLLNETIERKSLPDDVLASGSEREAPKAKKCHSEVEPGSSRWPEASVMGLKRCVSAEIITRQPGATKDIASDKGSISSTATSLVSTRTYGRCIPVYFLVLGLPENCSAKSSWTSPSSASSVSRSSLGSDALREAAVNDGASGADHPTTEQSATDQHGGARHGQPSLQRKKAPKKP